ncbi:hypothetical protein [Amycolatopsis sp. cmx-4-54]
MITVPPHLIPAPGGDHMTWQEVIVVAILALFWLGIIWILSRS